MTSFPYLYRSRISSEGHAIIGQPILIILLYNIIMEDNVTNTATGKFINNNVSNQLLNILNKRIALIETIVPTSHL